MVVRFLTFEQFHGKRNVGSTDIRVHQLIRNWPEAALYKYGEKPDVLIFQKVYAIDDYRFPEAFSGTKILDICDPDWYDGALVKRTIDAMDAVTCPTEAMQKFLMQMTDKPVVVIPDRFDLAQLPRPKKHSGEAKKAVWFGYAHNAVTLKFAIKAVERKGIHITVIANEDPHIERWGISKENYSYQKYNHETIFTDIQQHDFALLPVGSRPQDVFKSNNKEIRANLAGLPVVKDLESLEEIMDEAKRAALAEKAYNEAKEDYDIRLSVEQYKELIRRIIDGYL